MTPDKLIGKALDNALPLAIGAAIIVGALYFLARKTASDAAGAVGGVLSGDNALTEGTAYEGTGVVGTVGAAVNEVSGGTLQTIGETVSSWFAPKDTTDNLYYVAVFPDGARHSIAGSRVAKDGTFMYNGLRYRFGYNREGIRIAVRY